MKALSLIALTFAAFLIILGWSSENTAGDVLGKAVIIGGVLIAAFVAVAWILMFIKEKREKDSESNK
ncbi:MAG: hypothetical protein ACR2HG_10665 [Pyrinomonadaceae bacterium]